MPVDGKTIEALNLEDIRDNLPSGIKVIGLWVQNYVDSTGDETIRVLIVIDERTNVYKISGKDVSDLKWAIREHLKEKGITQFIYFKIGKPSEVREENLLEWTSTKT
ncbi:MAG: hypothetical protein NUW37_17450 [Planctomycetes bacterium]|nr:hypothetical protein [Planctomycetota bacterium]